MRGFGYTMIVLVAAGLTPHAVAAAPWTCFPETGFVCGADGCSTRTPTVTVIIEQEEGRYGRCDTKGCDWKPARLTRSGAFVSAEFGPGVLFKAAADGSSFVEVVTLGSVAYGQYGTCR